jgi:hypothetical protein
MKAVGIFAAGLAAGIVTIVVPRLAGVDVVAHLRHHLAAHSDAALAHAEATFEFVADAPMEKVAPLMGADRERLWAPGWDPHFVYPKPAVDQVGMVFTVSHGPFLVPWVNTEFDPAAGRMQYVYVVPDTLVTVITIRLTGEGSRTRVAVKYDRTALTTAANKRVQNMSEHDRGSGPEWKEQIEGWLAKEGVPTTK